MRLWYASVCERRCLCTFVGSVRVTSGLCRTAIGPKPGLGSVPIIAFTFAAATSMVSILSTLCVVSAAVEYMLAPVLVAAVEQVAPSDRLRLPLSASVMPLKPREATSALE